MFNEKLKLFGIDKPQIELYLTGVNEFLGTLMSGKTYSSSKFFEVFFSKETIEKFNDKEFFNYSTDLTWDIKGYKYGFSFILRKKGQNGAPEDYYVYCDDEIFADFLESKLDSPLSDEKRWEYESAIEVLIDIKKGILKFKCPITNKEYILENIVLSSTPNTGNKDTDEEKRQFLRGADE